MANFDAMNRSLRRLEMFDYKIGEENMPEERAIEEAEYLITLLKNYVEDLTEVDQELKMKETVMKCILCDKETTGSAGRAFIGKVKWACICQPCKDAEDEALAKKTTHIANVLDITQGLL